MRINFAIYRALHSDTRKGETKTKVQKENSQAEIQFSKIIVLEVAVSLVLSAPNHDPCDPSKTVTHLTH